MASFSQVKKGVDEPKRNLQHLSGCPVGKYGKGVFVVTPECEVVILEAEGNEKDPRGVALRRKNCKKHPGHPGFIPIHEFGTEHLPVNHRNPRVMFNVFLRSALALRIRVSYTSKKRPDTFADNDAPYPYSQYRGNNRVARYGTGNVVDVFYRHSVKDKACPCPECRDSDNPKKTFWWIRARTATHVIYDRSEAEHARLDCFYDSEDGRTVKTIYGYDTFNAQANSHISYRNDVCDLLCVSHDHEAVAMLNRIVLMDYRNNLTPESKVIVSHPHGCSKHITVGDVLHVTVPIGPEYPVNTPIPFKEGTVFRRRQTGPNAQTNEARLSSQRPDLFTREDKNSTIDNEAPTGNNPKVEESMLNYAVRLEAIRASLELDLSGQDNTTNSSTLTPPRQTKEDYLLGLYFSLIRERCLHKVVTWVSMLPLWCGMALQRRIIKVIDLASRIYLVRRDSRGQCQGHPQGHCENLCQGHGESTDDDAALGGRGLDSCNSTTHTPNGTKDSHSDHLLPLLSYEEGTDSNSSSRRVGYPNIVPSMFVELTVRSEEHFVRFLEEKKSTADDSGGSGGGGFGGCGDGRCTVPIIVRWFEGIGQILDSIKSEVASKGETIITEDVLAEATQRSYDFGHRLMTEYDDLYGKETKEEMIAVIEGGISDQIFNFWSDYLCEFKDSKGKEIIINYNGGENDITGDSSTAKPFDLALKSFSDLMVGGGDRKKTINNGCENITGDSPTAKLFDLDLTMKSFSDLMVGAGDRMKETINNDGENITGDSPTVKPFDLALKSFSDLMVGAGDRMKETINNDGENITGDSPTAKPFDLDLTLKSFSDLMVGGGDKMETKNDGIWRDEDVNNEDSNIDSGGEGRNRRKRKKEENDGEEGKRVVITTTTATNYGEAEKEKGEKRVDGDSGVEEGGGGREGGGGETIESVPEGASFILPSDAEYAYRAYSGNPDWINFPPGTLMVFSPATAITDDMNNPNPNAPVPVPIGEPLFEFQHQVEKPELRYVTYNTDTCPGSSGASVYCDFLHTPDGGCFPHSGSLGKAVNRSGIENPSFFRNTNYDSVI